MDSFLGFFLALVYILKHVSWMFLFWYNNEIADKVNKIPSLKKFHCISHYIEDNGQAGLSMLF